MPPYIYLGRFQKLKDVLLEALQLSSRCTEPSASTIAATNSLSSWLIIELAHSWQQRSDPKKGFSIVSITGEALYPLALRMLVYGGI